MRPLASRISVLTGEGALSVFAHANELERQGRSIIHLELGEPDFHADKPVLDALKAALEAGRDRYCNVAGVPALREEIASYLSRTRSIAVDPNHIVIAPGCKIALFLAMMALLEVEDEVLYPEPGFPGYPSITRGFGGVCVPYLLTEKNQMQPDPAEIAAKITPRTKVIVTCSPNNPTGSVTSDAVQRRIAELAVQHDLYVISDEIYGRIVYNGEYFSMLRYPGMAERTLIVDGFSKSFAMTGWRLGYTIAPAHIVAAMTMLAINSYTCVAEFTQYAAIEALRDSDSAVPRMVAEFAKRGARFAEGLNRVPGFRCLAPEGAFYAWVNVSETGLSAEEVCRIMLEDAGVAAIPGAAFGPSAREFVRFSFASSIEKLDEALARIMKVSSVWQSVAAHR